MISQTRPLPTLSLDEARTLCNNLFVTTNELIALLDEETQLLRKANTTELSSMTVRKDALTATLAHHMQSFKANVEELRANVPE